MPATESLILGLAAIVMLGLFAQWAAWKLRLPSILLLLVIGYVAGPGVSGLVKPDAILGRLLLPLVSLSVAILLFEGGLTLRLRDIGENLGVVAKLVTLGAAITWALAAAAAHLLLGLGPALATLLGALLVVTGPTVVTPLLRQIRPTGAAGSVLKWEGILIDPVGAALAVLVFEGILAGGEHHFAWTALKGVLRTLLVGGGIGLLAAWVLTTLLRRYLVPDYLHNGVALATVVAAYCAANTFQDEAGLLAVTLMGVYLANQQHVSVRHILEFKENLQVLIISILFIVLAARLRLDDLARLDLRMVGFLFLLIFVVRPLAVLACTAKSSLKRQERAFIAGVAPRGIVAAAIASVFALRLEAHQLEGADELVSLTFLVIFGTVAIYGLAAAPMAYRLGLAVPSPQGMLIIGAHGWARDLAATLRDAGVRSLLVDTNPRNASAARMEGLPVHLGNPLTDEPGEEIDLQGLGRLLALTRNDEVNALCTIHYSHLFGRGEVYQLAPADQDHAADLSGRFLFDAELGFEQIEARVEAGARVKATRLTEQFDYQAWLKQYGADAMPLATVDEGGRVVLATADSILEPRAGDMLIALVTERAEQRHPPT